MSDEELLNERYLIGEEIGVGGFGRVVAAEDKLLHRPLALKTLLSQSGDAEQRRFIEEAQITGSLSHPTIVPVHELNRDEAGQLFIVMKLVAGEDLSDVIVKLAQDDPETVEAYPLRRLVRLFLKVCEAIAFAHERGVLHRDIKPANIRLGRDDEVLVMDWGLARQKNAEPSEAEAAAARSNPTAAGNEAKLQVSADLTQEGDVIGTPAYMPPEQLDDPGGVDERADVYSLGATLYEILCLERPYDGSSFQALNALVKGPPPPPTRVSPDRDIPGHLDYIARKAMRRAPPKRYASVRELIADIESWLDEDASAEAGLLQELRGAVVRLAAPLAVAAVLLLLGAAGLLALRASARDAAAQATAEGIASAALQDLVTVERGRARLATGYLRVVEALEPVALRVQRFAQAAEEPRPLKELEARLLALRGEAGGLNATLATARSQLGELTASASWSPILDLPRARSEERDALVAAEGEASGAPLEAPLTELGVAAEALRGELARRDALQATIDRLAGAADAILVEAILRRDPAALEPRLNSEPPLLLTDDARAVARARAALRIGEIGRAKALVTEALGSRTAAGLRLSGREAPATAALLALAELLPVTGARHPLPELLETLELALSARAPRPALCGPELAAALSLADAQPWLALRRAEALALAGELERAELAFEQAQRCSPVDPWVSFERLSHLAPAHPSEALLSLEMRLARERAPRSPWPPLLERWLSVWREDDLGGDRLEQGLSDIAQLEGSGRLPQVSAWRWRARLQLARGRFEDARASAQSLLSALPGDVEACELLAEACLGVGDAAGAGAAVESGIAVAPAAPALLAARGELHRRAGRLDEAIADLEAAAPRLRSPLGWERLAEARLARGREEDLSLAARAAREAIARCDLGQRGEAAEGARISPADPTRLERLARIFEAQGRPLAALLAALRARELCAEEAASTERWTAREAFTLRAIRFARAGARPAVVAALGATLLEREPKLSEAQRAEVEAALRP